MPDQACLSILNHFDFWSAVPLEGTASYDDIVKGTDLPRQVIQRVLDHATTLRLFEKVDGKADHVKHSCRSAALAKSSGLRALVSTVLDDAGPPMVGFPLFFFFFFFSFRSLEGDLRSVFE